MLLGLYVPHGGRRGEGMTRSLSKAERAWLMRLARVLKDQPETMEVALVNGGIMCFELRDCEKMGGTGYQSEEHLAWIPSRLIPFGELA